MTVSFNGADKAVYELMMGGLNFEQAKKNLKLAVEMSKDSGTEVGANICITKQTQKQLEKITDYLKKTGINTIYLAKCHNRGGFLKGDLVCSTPAPTFEVQRCDVFTSTMFVSWTGDVLSCCHDLAGANIMGSLKSEKIETIQLRKTNIAEEGVKFDICRECNDLQRFMKDKTPDGSPLNDWIYNLYKDEGTIDLPEVSSLSEWIYNLYFKEGQVKKYSKILVAQVSKLEALNLQFEAMKREFDATKIIDLKDQLKDKEVHIKNIETKMNMMLESKVWRAAEFFRKVFYMKIH